MLKVMQLLAFAFGFVILAGTGQPRADIVKQQPPCASSCAGLTAGTTGIINVRAVTFAAPGPGTLTLTFHGWLYCLSSAATAVNIIVDSQIVEGAAAPDAAGQSGLEYYATMQPGNMVQQFATFNLSSQRVFKIEAAGSQVYRFRVTRNIPMGANCTIYNGTFTTDFRE